MNQSYENSLDDTIYSDDSSVYSMNDKSKTRKKLKLRPGETREKALERIKN